MAGLKRRGNQEEGKEESRNIVCTHILGFGEGQAADIFQIKQEYKSEQEKKSKEKINQT